MSSLSPAGLVLIDTSAWICFFRKDGFNQMKSAISTLLNEDRVAITGPVLIELIQGCRSEKEKKQISQYSLGMQWLAVTDDHWHQAAELAFSLRRKGITTSAMDTLISAIAIHYHCELLHCDSDYGLIAGNSGLKSVHLM